MMVAAVNANHTQVFRHRRFPYVSVVSKGILMSFSSAGVAVGVPSIGLVLRFAVAVTSFDPRWVTWVFFWANVLVSSMAYAALGF